MTEIRPDTTEFKSAWRSTAVLLAVFALVLYAMLIGHFVYACAGGSDSSGYLNEARLLASGCVHVPPRALSGLPPAQTPPDLYMPLGFKFTPGESSLVPTYPPGLPLLLAAAAPVAGWKFGPNLVMGAQALLGVLLTYGLGRAVRLPGAWAALGATMIAASPLYLMYALQAMSDLPALVWTTAAVLAAWMAGTTDFRGPTFRLRTVSPRQAVSAGSATEGDTACLGETLRRRKVGPPSSKSPRLLHAAWAFAAGAIFSMAVLIRPSDVIALVPVAIALGLSPRRWLLFALGALPGSVFYVVYTRAAYGSVLTTGYGAVGTLFSAGSVAPTLLHYAHWLPMLFTPAVFLALGLPWAARKERRAAAVLGSWALVYLAFYSTYRFTHETWWYLRFLLPAAPALVVGGLLVARQCIQVGLGGPARPFVIDYQAVGNNPQGYAERTAGRPAQPYLHICRLILFAAAFALVAANGAWWGRLQKLDVLDSGRGENKYPQTMAWVRDHVPSDAVLGVMQMSGAAFFYTDLTLVRWDQLDAETFRSVVAAAQAAHRPIYAALYSFENTENRVLQDRMPGDWAPVGAVQDITIWRLIGEKAMGAGQ